MSTDINSISIDSTFYWPDSHIFDIKLSTPYTNLHIDV